MSTENPTAADTFGQRLRELRGDMHKVDFARKLNTSAQNYGRYESGRIPDAEMLQAIANRCGVSVDWLLGGEKKGEFSVRDSGPEWETHGSRRRTIEQPRDEDLFRHFDLEWLRGAFAAATAAGDVHSAAYIGSLIVEREKTL